MLSTTNNNEIKGSTRVEMFSDGVFAIAITLLVLELIQIIHIKPEKDLITTCLDHWQSFLSFFIGFTTILVCWINHHEAFRFIHKVDTRFLWVNGFLLFIVTLTPFPTAVLAEYLQKESKIALAIFGFNYILISFAAHGICAYAYRHHLIPEEDRNYFHDYKLIYRFSIFYTVLAFFICFIFPWLSMCLYIMLFAAFAAPRKLTLKLKKIQMSRRYYSKLKKQYRLVKARLYKKQPTAKQNPAITR